MPIRNTKTRYGSVAQLLHWLIAALIVTQFVLAQLAERAGEAGREVVQIGLLANHKSVGITILGLAALRVLWRFISPPPPLPLTMPRWQRCASQLSHWLLYAFIFALPISGWLLSSSAAFTVSLFGLVALPDLVGANEALSGVLKAVHEFLAGALFVVVGIHVAAALKHHLVDRDDVLRRMSSVTSLMVFVLVALGASWVLSDIDTVREPVAAPGAGAAVTASATTAVRDPGLPPWAIDYPRSTIRFAGQQAGAEFRGTWRSWQAELRFDAANLAASSFVASVDIASVDTGNADRDQTIMGVDWFDQPRYPTALFTTETIRARADGSYSADALLTVKGRAVPITFDFTVREDATRQLLEGRATVLDGNSLLDRLALSLGTGDWADTSQIGQFVKVQVHVEATVAGRD